MLQALNSSKKEMKAKVLIIKDEKSIRYTLNEFLLKEGYDVLTAEDFDEALKIIKKQYIDLILTDIILGDKTGIDLLGEIKERNLNCSVVIFTEQSNIETAAGAIRLGAYDYLAKPFKKGELLHTVRMALKNKALIEEKNKYREEIGAIFKSVNDALIAVDKDLKVIEVNETAKEICGFFREEILGKPLDDILKMCSGQCITTVKKTKKEKQSVEVYRAECKHKIRKGQVVTLNTFPFTDFKGKFSGCVMVVKDETHVANLEKEMEERHRFSNIVGKNEKMQKIYSLIESLHDTDTTVLITGESGTGKELIAEALHYGGKRCQGPFVKVNCSALPETLLESELFGHTKGSFTGAVADNVGRFKRADGGTIFLDEIGDISLSAQLRLLRVIQEKQFESVGDSTPIKVDVRIVAATNSDLQGRIKQGKFREDLYYRLRVVELDLPPLRDRRNDILLLVEHFMKKFNRKFKRDINSISNDVRKIFMDYHWPGNIRELENTIEHAFIICNEAEITVEGLPKELKSTKAVLPVDKKNGEYEAILQALEKTHWNKTKAASLLGITRRTIYNKIKNYDIH